MVSDTLRPNNGGGLRPHLLALDELSGGSSQVHSPLALTSVSHRPPTLCVTPWRLLVLLTAFQRHIQLKMPTKNTPNARACQKHAKCRYPQAADTGPKGCVLRPRIACVEISTGIWWSWRVATAATSRYIIGVHNVLCLMKSLPAPISLRPERVVVSPARL